ncbi:MAG: glycoside hydrolase family 25 protein [Lachnospiraceae bacterium]|nr:glycoside hydrolase family 25 protein [Lachnospiraceae bacterium]
MRDTIIKTVIYLLSAGVLVAIGAIIGININLARVYPAFVNPEGHNWIMETGYEGELIDDNFWNFVDASYILIGTPPDCEFYKIVSEIPRHDFAEENFYMDSDADMIYYHEDDGSRASTIAIDVSTYQTDVDWEAVKASGVDVAMIRVGFRGYGTGRIVLDNMFEQHVVEARDAGLDVGVYFFSQAINYDEGVEEAKFVINAIRDYNITGPVAIDTEFVDASDARTLGLDVDSRTDSVVGFCDAIKSAGYTPMVYANRNWFIQCLDMTRLEEYKLWLAHYTNQTDFPYLFTGWQYTNAGSVYGISGDVDLNVWFD